MSKKIEQNILNKIKLGELSMRPKYLFVLTTVISIVGLVISATAILFSYHVIYFLLTHPGPGAERKIIYLLTSLPWYLAPLAIISIVGAISLSKRFDFSYRTSKLAMLALTLAGLLVGNTILNNLGLDNFLQTRGFFRNNYSSYQPVPQFQLNFGKNGTVKPSYSNKGRIFYENQE